MGIAFILLLAIGKLILAKADVAWMLFQIVYGIDGCLAIVHRIQLHYPLGEAHRKHVYQLIANELGISHVTVSMLYMTLHLVISLVLINLIPDTLLAHWIYLFGVIVLLALVYMWFMKKYYHLHEEWLKGIGK